jgi:hypothetical protein
MTHTHTHHTHAHAHTHHSSQLTHCCHFHTHTTPHSQLTSSTMHARRTYRHAYAVLPLQQALTVSIPKVHTAGGGVVAFAARCWLTWRSRCEILCLFFFFGTHFCVACYLLILCTTAAPHVDLGFLHCAFLQSCPLQCVLCAVLCGPRTPTPCRFVLCLAVLCYTDPFSTAVCYVLTLLTTAALMSCCFLCYTYAPPFVMSCCFILHGPLTAANPPTAAKS